MLQILDYTEARLTTLTPRSEKHGDDDVPAVSLGLEITTGNAILDLIDKALRSTLYKHPQSATLPGVDDPMTVLACNSVDRVLLPTKHEGWSLEVDDGIDDTTPMVFGGCKVDKVSVEPHQGGSITLRLRVGTSDLDAARSGMLGMHVGKPLWVKLIAPKPGAEKKPGAEQPDDDATSLFANGDGSNEPPPQSVTHEPPEADDESAPKASAGKRTARGNARTAAHLAAGRP